MKLRVLRSTAGDTFTEGKFFVDGIIKYYTLEDTDRYLEEGHNPKVYGKTAIPRGIYEVDITFSERFQRDLILVKNVPLFTGVRIHPGNSSKDTDGCILVGMTNARDDDDWIGSSKLAYNELHSLVEEALNRGEKVTLEVV